MSRYTREIKKKIDPLSSFLFNPRLIKTKIFIHLLEKFESDLVY